MVSAFNATQAQEWGARIAKGGGGGTSIWFLRQGSSEGSFFRKYRVRKKY